MSIHVQFVSPERVIFEAEAKEIIVRTTDGEIGFLTGHVPFVGVLAVAEARIYDVDDSTIHSFAGRSRWRSIRSRSHEPSFRMRSR